MRMCQVMIYQCYGARRVIIKQGNKYKRLIENTKPVYIRSFNAPYDVSEFTLKLSEIYSLKAHI